MQASKEFHVIRILRQAFILPWSRRTAFFRTLAMPIALLTTATMLMEVDTGASVWESLRSVLILLVLLVYFQVCIAVTCHRLVLLPSGLDSQSWIPKWTMREVKFFLAGAAVTAICCLAGSIVSIAIRFFDNWSGASGDWSDLSDWQVQLCMLVGWLVFTRFSLMFPEIAVSGRISVKLAWARSRGRFFALFATAGLFPFLLGVGFAIVPIEGETWLRSIAINVVSSISVIVEVVALSLSYQSIVNEEP